MCFCQLAHTISYLNTSHCDTGEKNVAEKPKSNCSLKLVCIMANVSNQFELSI